MTSSHPQYYSYWISCRQTNSYRQLSVNVAKL